MDLDLKQFEDKINNITEKFMSLLDADDVIGYSTEPQHASNIGFDNFGTESQHVGGIDFGNHTIENNVVAFDSVGGIKFDNSLSGLHMEGSVPRLQAEDINIGGMAFGEKSAVDSHDYINEFDTAVQAELNNRLASLYDEKKTDARHSNYVKKNSVAFSDANLRAHRVYNNLLNSDEPKHVGGIFGGTNDKEVFEMSNYGEENGGKIFSFATIPVDQSLTVKKSFKEVLFTDIPWDTQIDIAGQFKKLWTTKIKITF